MTSISQLVMSLSRDAATADGLSAVMGGDGLGGGGVGVGMVGAGLNMGQQVESIEANKGYTFEEQFKQLYELSDDPRRKEFLDDLFQFMADRNQPVNRIPIMAKQVLDLYELYNLVVARGGLVEVINKKIWREITKGLNLPSSITSAAFTLRTQYMKYLYPYECAKNNFSHQEELQQAIDGNRREGRRAAGPGLGHYNSFLAAMNGGGQANNNNNSLSNASATNNGNHNLMMNSATGNHNHNAGLMPGNNHNHNHMSSHNSSSSTTSSTGSGHHHASANNHHHGQPHRQQQQHHNHHHHHQQQQQQQQQQLQHQLQLQHQAQALDLHQQRIYQDSIESDHDDDDASIDLDHSSKRNSPILDEHQHLDSHNHHQQATAEQHQQFAAAAAILRQQLGAFNFPGAQNFLSQLTSQLNPSGQPTNLTNATAQNPNHANSTPVNQPNPSSPNAAALLSNVAAGAPGDLMKQQQEQFLAALMAAANQDQQQQPQQQQTQAQQQTGATPDQVRAAFPMMASNAMLITAPNAPDAISVAATAQAIGVKGAFVILLL